MTSAINKIELYEKSLERMLAWVQASESRLGIIVPTATSMLGVMSGLAGFARSFNWLLYFALILSVIFLILSLVFAFFAVYPRVNGPKDSLIFFGKVKMLSVEDFRLKMDSASESSYAEDLLRQIHVNAQIADEKYSWIRRSMSCLMFAAVPWMVVVYLIFDLNYGAS